MGESKSSCVNCLNEYICEFYHADSPIVNCPWYRPWTTILRNV